MVVVLVFFFLNESLMLVDVFVFFYIGMVGYVLVVVLVDDW